MRSLKEHYVIARLMGLSTISPGELLALAQTASATVFDVNSLPSWQRAHVPSARHLDPTRFQWGDLPQDRSAALVFYCSNPLCRKAPLAARRARELGYTNVRVMSAGIQGWLAARLPIESGESLPQADKARA